MIRLNVAFTKTYSRGKWLISHLPPTFAIIIHTPRPCVWRPGVRVPHVPTYHTWCPQVPRLASLSPKSPQTSPDVPVPLLYTAFVILWFVFLVKGGQVVPRSVSFFSFFFFCRAFLRDLWPGCGSCSERLFSCRRCFSSALQFGQYRPLCTVWDQSSSDAR